MSKGPCRQRHHLERRMRDHMCVRKGVCVGPGSGRPCWIKRIWSFAAADNHEMRCCPLPCSMLCASCTHPSVGRARARTPALEPGERRTPPNIWLNTHSAQDQEARRCGMQPPSAATHRRLLSPTASTRKQARYNTTSAQGAKGTSAKLPSASSAAGHFCAVLRIIASDGPEIASSAPRSAVRGAQTVNRCRQNQSQKQMVVGAATAHSIHAQTDASCLWHSFLRTRHSHAQIVSTTTS